MTVCLAGHASANRFGVALAAGYGEGLGSVLRGYDAEEDEPYSFPVGRGLAYEVELIYCIRPAVELGLVLPSALGGRYRKSSEFQDATTGTSQTDDTTLRLSSQPVLLAGYSRRVLGHGFVSRLGVGAGYVWPSTLSVSEQTYSWYSSGASMSRAVSETTRIRGGIALRGVLGLEYCVTSHWSMVLSAVATPVISPLHLTAIVVSGRQSNSSGGGYDYQESNTIEYLETLPPRTGTTTNHISNLDATGTGTVIDTSTDSRIQTTTTSQFTNGSPTNRSTTTTELKSSERILLESLALTVGVVWRF